MLSPRQNQLSPKTRKSQDTRIWQKIYLNIFDNVALTRFSRVWCILFHKDHQQYIVVLSSVKCRELWERLGVIQALSYLSNLSSDFREFDWFCFTRITNSTAMVLHIFALAAFSSIKFRESCEPAWSDQAFKLVWCDCESPFLFNSELRLLVYLILFLKHHQEYCLFLHWLHCQVGRAVRQLGVIGSRPFPSFPTRALVLCATPARRKAACHPTCSHSHNVTPDHSRSACHKSEKGTFSQRQIASTLSTLNGSHRSKLFEP